MAPFAWGPLARSRLTTDIRVWEPEPVGLGPRKHKRDSRPDGAGRKRGFRDAARPVRPSSETAGYALALAAVAAAELAARAD